MPTLHRYPTAAEFLQLAQPALEAQEVTNSLILGVTIRLHERPDWIDTPPYLSVVTSSGAATGAAASSQPVLMAAITPPHNLLLAGTTGAAGTGDETGLDAALSVLIQNLRAEAVPFPGVIAESRLAQRFVETWRQATGAGYSTRTRLRVYALRQVIPPNPPAPGHLRLATPADLELLTRWRAEFTRESLHEEPSADLQAHVLRLIQASTLYLWDDHGPVSTAALTRPTPHGISVGGVYTPPAQRGRGYASACVAALSQGQLAAGRRFTSLFTDLDYPTSNDIYMKIGYRPVCDFTEYALTLSSP